MKKKSLITLLAVSTLTFATAHVLAEDTAPVDPTASVEVTLPTTTQPSSDPSTVAPVEPTAPSIETTTPAPEPSQSNSEVPSDSSSTSQASSKEQSDKSSMTLIDSTVPSSTDTKTEVSKTEKKDAPESRPNASSEVKPEEKLPKADKAIENGQSQIGTYSKETKQVVSEVSPVKPVTTETGYTIIGTQDSQVIIQASDGTQSVLSAEAVGGKVNADKTISIKTKDGKMTTLPTTGEKSSTGLFFTGLLALFSPLFLKKKWSIK